MTARTGRTARTARLAVAAAALAVVSVLPAPATSAAVAPVPSAPSESRRVDLRVVATGIPACTQRIDRVRITIDNVRSTVPVTVRVKVNKRVVVKKLVVKPLTGWPRSNGAVNTFRLPKPMLPSRVLVAYVASAPGLSSPITGRMRPTRYCPR
ncbi:MAG: hypothetical protein R2737_01850 [Candidatus Nanopelagicales bacterium]